MSLAFIVYFSIMAILVGSWALPARQAVLGPLHVSRAATRAAVGSIIAFTVLIGGRYNVGGDFFGYIDYYRFSSLTDRSSDVGFEPGFLLLIQALKFLSLPDRSIIFASSFIQILLFSLWLRKHPQLAPFTAFTFVALLLLDMDNIVRQGIAFFAILLAVSALNDRRWLVFAAWVFVGYLFHRSGLIIFPVGIMIYWFRVPPVSTQIAALALSYALISLFFNQIVGLFELLSPVFGYSGYANVTRSDLAFVKTANSTFNLGTYLWPLIDGTIILYSRVIGRRYDRMGYRLYHALFLIAALLQPVANSWDFLPFSRALFYFTAMRAICLAFVLHYCFAGPRRNRDVVIAVGIVSVLLLWLVIAVARGAAWSAPFQFS